MYKEEDFSMKPFMNKKFREKLFMAFYPLVNRFYFYGTLCLIVVLMLDYIHVTQYTDREYSIWGAFIRHWYLTFFIPFDIYLIVKAKKKYSQLSATSTK